MRIKREVASLYAASQSACSVDNGMQSHELPREQVCFSAVGWMLPSWSRLTWDLTVQKGSCIFIAGAFSMKDALAKLSIRHCTSVSSCTIARSARRLLAALALLLPDVLA